MLSEILDSISACRPPKAILLNLLLHLTQKIQLRNLIILTLRLQVLSQNLNDSLVCITHHHDANKTQFDLVTASVNNLNSMCDQLTQRQSALEQQTHAINQNMDLLLKHLGKHEIGEYVDENVRKHVGSTHTRVQVILEVVINPINSQMVCMTI